MDSAAAAESKPTGRQRFVLASLSALSEKREGEKQDEMCIQDDDGSVNQGEESSGSSYTLSYWDLERSIPVQFKEVPLPFEEDVLILSFTESMRPYLLTRNKHSLEYFVQIFDDGKDLAVKEDETLFQISKTQILTLQKQELE